MKTDPTDPPRIVDEEAPEALRELVYSNRETGPSDDAMRRMSKRLAAAGVIAPAAIESAAAPRARHGAAYQKLGFVALAVAGGLVLSWRATQALPPSEAGGNAPPAATVSAEARRAEPAEPSTTRELVDDRPPAPAISVDDLPAAAPRLPSSPVPTGNVARTSAKPSNEGSHSRGAESELELVQRAQAALVADPERTLAIAGEHARVYPTGELVQEREVLGVEALARLGRKDDALRRARALVQRFPRTPYAARLEVAIGHPLSSNSSAADPLDRRAPASPPATPAR